MTVYSCVMISEMSEYTEDVDGLLGDDDDEDLEVGDDEEPLLDLNEVATGRPDDDQLKSQRLHLDIDLGGELFISPQI